MVYVSRIFRSVSLYRKPLIQAVSMVFAPLRKTASLSFFAEIPGYSFNEAGQLQGRALPGSKSNMLISHQSAFFSYLWAPR